MPKIEPFEKFTLLYEKWFEKHSKLYGAEIKAIKELLPYFEKGIEIGVGSGRFALPLGIKVGVEPSDKMAKIANLKGIKTVKAVAENLPFSDKSFDLALMVTTICFVGDPLKSLKEVWRILKPKGFIIIGFVDKKSTLGKLYEKQRKESKFYKEATFFSTDEILSLLKGVGFGDCKIKQTLFGEDLEHMQTYIKNGYGKGAFIVIRCQKSA